MLIVENVFRSFGDLQAVCGVTFELEAGEILGLLGPNGAGKSTLLGMISGLLAPDQGSVKLPGGDPRTATARQSLGLAPQSLSLYEELSAGENLDFIGRIYGLRGAELTKRVDHCLEFAGLASRRNDRVGSYSGGMKRRLNLACSLIHDPPLLLLDEPTVGVDPQSRAHLFKQIESLRDAGKALIYATHYMEEAARLCRRVAIMDHGKFLALDRVDTLIEQHGGTSSVRLVLKSDPPEDVMLPGELHDGVVEWQTDSALDDLVKLSRAGLQWEEVAIRSPDLETVFLKMTGRSLRDGAEDTSANQTDSEMVAR